MDAKESVDDIVAKFASWFQLLLGAPDTLDRVIEIVAPMARSNDSIRGDFCKIAKEKEYCGDNPDIMLILYDILGGKSRKSLAYGIRGFESSGRDPEKIVALENPDRLVEYVIGTADNLDELVKLKDVLLLKSRFYPEKLPYSSDQVVNAKKNLVNSVLLVANEIAEQLKDIDLKKVDIKSLSLEDSGELLKRLLYRNEAHAAIVIAYQAKYKNPANEKALEALAFYEKLTGRYDRERGFTRALMEAYAARKYGTDKLSTGEVPEGLKADPDWLHNYTFDKFFRAIHFGIKEPEWKRRGRGAKRLDEDVASDLPKVRWQQYKEELRLVGVNPQMSYNEARIAFRKGIIQRRSILIQTEVTPDYKRECNELADFIDAWRKLEPLYGR